MKRARLDLEHLGALILGLGFVLAIPVGGCDLPARGSEEVASVVARNQSGRAAIAESYASVPVPAPGLQERPPSEMQVPRSLSEFIGAALERNPDILAAEKLAAARSERIAQVVALPDPMLMTRTMVEPVRTADGDNYFTLGVQQGFPVPEKLDRAGQIALEETRMAIEQLQETRRRVIGDVKRAWYQLYVVDRSMEITRDNQDLLRGLIDVALGQVAVGRRSQEDVLRTIVELSNLEAELIRLGQRRTTTAAELNRLMNRRPDEPIATLGRLGVRDVDTELKTLLSRAAELNPELKRLAHQIERDRQAVRLSELGWWPDFTLGFEWMQMDPRAAFRPPIDPRTGMRPKVSQMSEEGMDSWGITFGLNIPIWFDKIVAGIRQARREMEASMQAHASLRNAVFFRVEDALARIQSEQQRARLFADTIIPQAQQAYEVSVAAYTAGTGDFLFVIDNWRKWLMFMILYHESVGALEQGVADLEQAVGASMSELGASS